jgi:hypothetical protein
MRVIECRVARCLVESLPDGKMCETHEKLSNGGAVPLPMKRGAPRVIRDTAGEEVEGGDPEVQEAGVPKVGHRRAKAGRSDSDVPLPDMSADIRVFPKPPAQGGTRSGRKKKGRRRRKSGKAARRVRLEKPAENPLAALVKPDHARTVEALISNDPDPAMYGGKFLIPLVESIEWETLDLEVCRKLLAAINAASEKGSPIIRGRFNKSQETTGYACAYCETEIQDGKWWNRTVMRDDAGLDVPVHFDSNRCYLMFFQGDRARSRAVQAR